MLWPINIPQTIECSVQSSASSDIFCRIRTWFLTLLTNSVVSLPTMNYSKLAFPWTFSEAGFPRSFGNSFFVPCRMRGPCREGVLHDEDQLFPVNPKNFLLRFPWSIVLSISIFSTLEKTRMNHDPESSLTLTFPRVSPLYRQEQVVQDLDIHTKTSPGLQKLKKTRTKAFLRSNSS